MRSFLLAVTLSLLAFPAYAIMVTNLDTQPHILTVQQGNNVRQMSIEPNRHVRLVGGDMTLSTENGWKVDVRDYDEYVIWRGGKLSIQKRRPFSNSGS